MVDAQTLSIIFAGLSIGIAAIYYTMTLRNSQRAQQLQLETRQAQIFTQLYSEQRSPESIKMFRRALDMTWTDYDDFQSKYGVDSIDERMPYTAMAMVYEEMGVLVEQGLIDINLVIQLIGGSFRQFWVKFKPIIYETRERRNYPQYFDKMEYLYIEMYKLRGEEWTKRQDN